MDLLHMMREAAVQIGVIGVAAVLLFAATLVFDWIALLLGTKTKEKPKSYKEQMGGLTRKLLEASTEVDNVLQEMAEISKARESAIAQLEDELQNLAEREKRLKETVTVLESTPLPVAEYFADIVERGEKRNAWRDYALFGAGVLVSVVVGVILGAFGF